MYKKLLSFYKNYSKKGNTRYKSWEHCYVFFDRNKNINVAIEMYSLHLFAYLASWGMLRGSSFLLQRDYLFHNDIVEEILKEKYDSLRGISIIDMSDSNMDLIMELKKSISRIYSEKINKGKDKKESMINPTDTLISKILLGTLGCTPAYDRYFIAGMKKFGLPNRRLTKASLKTLKEFYKKNFKAFEEVQKEINSQSSVKYPTMKIIDMFFWLKGYEGQTQRDLL